jgi:hypothetical protein
VGVLRRGRLCQRPGSVGNADQALRSLAAFLAEQAPEVSAVADIQRHQRPAGRGPCKEYPRVYTGAEQVQANNGSVDSII